MVLKLPRTPHWRCICGCPLQSRGRRALSEQAARLRVWGPGAFRAGSRARELPRCKLSAARPGKGKARLLSPASPHQFLNILWHLNRLLLLWGRVTCTVTFVTMPSWWLPSVYQTIAWRWNYSRRFKVCVCRGQGAHQVWEVFPPAAGKGLSRRAQCPHLSALWAGTGSVWLDSPGEEACPVSDSCAVGNHKLEVSQPKGSLQDPELLVSETCFPVKQPLPRAVPSCLGTHGAVPVMNSGSPKRNHTSGSVGVTASVTPAGGGGKNVWDVGICAEQGRCRAVSLSPKPTSFKPLGKVGPHTRPGKLAGQVSCDQDV